MNDTDLINDFREIVAPAIGKDRGRITVDAGKLWQILDLADVALRYRRKAADRQKKLDRARKNLDKLDKMTP